MSETDIDTLTYEQARAELVAVVQRLEAGTDSLEESLSLWERGEKLAAHCQQWLDRARERLATARESSAANTAESESSDQPAS